MPKGRKRSQSVPTNPLTRQRDPQSRSFPCDGIDCRRRIHKLIGRSNIMYCSNACFNTKYPDPENVDRNENRTLKNELDQLSNENAQLKLELAAAKAELEREKQINEDVQPMIDLDVRPKAPRQLACHIASSSPSSSSSN